MSNCIRGCIKAWCCYQAKGSGPSPLLSTGCWVQSWAPWWKTNRQFRGLSPVKNHKVSDLGRQSKRPGSKTCLSLLICPSGRCSLLHAAPQRLLPLHLCHRVLNSTQVKAQSMTLFVHCHLIRYLPYCLPCPKAPCRLYRSLALAFRRVKTFFVPLCTCGQKRS